MLIDETLRKYPPAYIGPRRAMESFEFSGHASRRGAHVHYCSWASHHLPTSSPDPERFRPDRFTDEAQRAAAARAPTCRSAAARAPASGCASARPRSASSRAPILERFRLELVPGYELRIRHAPTISPRGGLAMTVRAAPPARVLQNEPAAIAA